MAWMMSLEQQIQDRDIFELWEHFMLGTDQICRVCEAAHIKSSYGYLKPFVNNACFYLQIAESDMQGYCIFLVPGFQTFHFDKSSQWNIKGVCGKHEPLLVWPEVQGKNKQIKVINGVSALRTVLFFPEIMSGCAHTDTHLCFRVVQE